MCKQIRVSEPSDKRCAKKTHSLFHQITLLEELYYRNANTMNYCSRNIKGQTSVNHFYSYFTHFPHVLSPKAHRLNINQLVPNTSTTIPMAIYLPTPRLDTSYNIYARNNMPSKYSLHRQNDAFGMVCSRRQTFTGKAH